MVIKLIRKNLKMKTKKNDACENRTHEGNHPMILS